MKILFRTAVFLLCGVCAGTVSFAQNSGLRAVVDSRVELLSILFRLAGREEYSTTYLKAYTDDIEKHFGTYKDHPAVQMAKRMSRRVGYDGVMAFAVHVSGPPEFKPLIPFNDKQPDARWGKDNAEEFASLLRAFYVDAHCEAFLKAHQTYYATGERNFETTLKGDTDTGWFASFFGEEVGDFKLVIGLGNGGNNYGATVTYPDGHEDRYSIISNSLPDSLGMPTFRIENIRSTIIHEYNHSFINHHVYAVADEFKPEVKGVFAQVREKMEKMHYGQWETMVNESLVRAGEIQYDKMHGATEGAITERIRNEQSRGFVWMDQLMDLFAKYNANRTTYPDFKSFLPEVIRFYKTLPAAKLVKAYEDNCAHVAQVIPLKGNDKNVDPALSEISIQFDRAMASKVSINAGDTGMDHFPFVRSKGSIKWSEDGKTLSLKVALKPDWHYEFVLTSMAFRTTEGYPLVEQTVAFKTSK